MTIENGISNQETTELKPYFIKTEYQPKKGAEIKVQWWLADLKGKEYYSLSNLMSGAGTVRTDFINEYFNRLKKVYTVRSIRFTPIIEPSEGALESRVCHRGYKGYIGDSKSDPDPIVIRKKELPEFTAEVSSNSIYFHHYGGGLTQGDKKQLGIWFNDQLMEAATEELLQYLIKHTIKECIEYTKSHVAEMEKSIENLKEFLDNIEY